MRTIHAGLADRVLPLLAGALVLKVGASVVSNYHNYWPPNFDTEFLHSRESYFFGPYQWAFYTHILAGPVSLILGLFLIGEWSRTRFRRWHHYLGRVQVACVLLLVTPSGLVMAYHAAAGSVAAVGLGTLAILTALSAALGARAAVTKHFTNHRRWMWRCYLLLCSAVVIRLIGGFASITGLGAPWIDSLASWISWLGPLTVFEFRERIMGRLWIPT